MGDTGPFSVGEKVLVPHTDKFYEAKVQKAQKREDGLWYYFLHYLGEHPVVSWQAGWLPGDSSSPCCDAWQVLHMVPFALLFACTVNINISAAI